MKNLLERFLPVFASDDGGGAGAGDAGAGGAQGNDASGAGAAGAGGAAAADGAGGSGPAAAAAAGAAGQPYRPEGLAETMFGKDDRETIDKMFTALKGYRERDSARGVPEKAEVYRKFDLEQAPAEIRGHIEALDKDPLFAEVARVAMERRIPVADMQALTMALYAKAQEAGILEAPVDAAAEREKLLPETAKGLPQAQQDAAIEAHLQANEDFVKNLMTPGADGKARLDQAVGENALLMLMDTALGNQFIEFFAAQMTGQNRAQPLPGNGGGGSINAEGLRARRALPENTPGDRKFNQASYDQLMADYKRLYPDE